MIKFAQKLILAVFFVLFSFTIFAQEKDIVFEQITDASGRSLGFITGIVQDNSGFMWFSTRNGLYRYNGYSYKLFKNSSKDSLSLPFNNIAYLYYDNHNNLWMRHYDKLSAFKDEKRSYEFDSITSKHYDIEVKILQDKYDNYWIGPTGNGIAKYNPNDKSYVTFTHPPETFSPQAWSFIDSLIQNNESYAQINNPKNKCDSTTDFSINKTDTFIIACSGEIDRGRFYDYGLLYKNGKKIWSFKQAKPRWSGGEEKNQFAVDTLILEPGNYQMSYVSDASHGCEKWDGKGPVNILFCGISLHKIGKNEMQIIKNGIFESHKGDNYLASKFVKDILIDNNGNFWALTNLGLEKFDYRKNKFVHFDIDFEALIGRKIKKDYLNFYQDNKGVFWIESMHGLIKYDNIWGKLVVFQNKPGKKVFTSNKIYSLFQDNQNQMWIGTDQGINVYDTERNTITEVMQNNHNRLYDNSIIQIFEDNGSNIWIATFEGLNRLIKNNFLYTNLNLDADHTFPAVYDAAANIWLGIDNQLLKYSSTFTTTENFIIPDKFFNINDFTGTPDYTINDMVKTDEHFLYLASDNKTYRYNNITKEIDQQFNAQAIIVGSDSIKNVVNQLIYFNHNLYAFCPNGFYCYALEQNNAKTFYAFNYAVDFIEEFDLNYFKTAEKDKTGNLWIRTSDGIYFFNTQLKQLEFVYEFDADFKGRPLADGQMDFDRFGNLWFATLPYINKISVETHKTERWKCDYEHEWGITNTKVSNNIIWNYGSNGLYSFNTETQEFNYYSIENGLIDNNINGLEEDNRGFIWLTTLKGLIKLDTAENNAKNYFTQTDFTTHRFLGNSRQFQIPGTEKILFTTKGFLSFNPDSINTAVPKIVIDRFTLRGKDYELDTLIYYKKKIQLKYKQNFIGFEFSALDYTDPALNKYKYRLLGLEDEWNIADANNRRANYSGISPGNYTLQVIGSNNDKVWNPEGARVQIIITPPWYKTILAYIIYGLVLVISIWLFIAIRERQLIEEKKILEKKVKERTAEIEAQKEELASQNEMIAEQHKNITDSIQYAQRIQRAILPPTEPLSDVLDEFFILYRPRDIVSGDYYWTARQNNITIIVAADCTGHGVPGAFMSMLGIAFLNEIVNKEGITASNEILNHLRNQVITQLHQTGAEMEAKDGMDISLYVIDHEKMILNFSGAYNPLYIIRNGEINQLKADRMPIGYHLKKDIEFTKQEFQLQKGDCLYNSSDGYPDQFGGPDGRKFMTKKFKELLLEIHQKPMAEQREILNTEFDKWRGETEQIDDVIVIGVKI